MNYKQLLAILLVFCLAMQLVGCSLMLMKEVPDNYKPSQELDCSGYAFPILDGAVALSIITGITMFFIDAFGPQESCPLPGLVLFVGLYSLFPMSLYTISSAVGFGIANDCHKARQVRQEWLQMTPEKQKEFEEQWRKGNNKL